MTDQTSQSFAQAASKALTAVAASQEQSTKGSTGSSEHKLAFLQTFRRWEILFKRADRGDVEADKWLIAEYYKSLGHLTPAGFELLTEQLKERCTFFPTIKECLEVINPPKYSYGNPFNNSAHRLTGSADEIGTLAWYRAARGDLALADHSSDDR